MLSWYHLFSLITMKNKENQRKISLLSPLLALIFQRRIWARQLSDLLSWKLDLETFLAHTNDSWENVKIENWSNSALLRIESSYLLQLYRKFYISWSDNVLDFKLLELHLVVKFLNDSCIFTCSLSRCTFILRSSDDHFPRREDQRCCFGFSYPYNHSCETLWKIGWEETYLYSDLTFGLYSAFLAFIEIFLRSSLHKRLTVETTFLG